MIVGQGPIALAVGAGGGGLDVFILNYPFILLSPSLLETARYRLKYCRKGPLNPKQPTNQPRAFSSFLVVYSWTFPSYSEYEPDSDKFVLKSGGVLSLIYTDANFP